VAAADIMRPARSALVAQISANLLRDEEYWT